MDSFKPNRSAGFIFAAYPVFVERGAVQPGETCSGKWIVSGRARFYSGGLRSGAREPGILWREIPILSGEIGVLSGEVGILSGEIGNLSGEDGILSAENGVLSDEKVKISVASGF